jgi:translocation and assembly module TamA
MTLPDPRRLLLLAVLLCPWSWPGSGAQAGEARIEVDVSGLEKDLRGNVLALLSIEQEKNAAQLTESRVRRLHKLAHKEIQTALQPFGYYHPVVESELTATEQGWKASYRVELGEPVRVAALNISIVGEGADDPGLTELIDRFPLQQGDILVHSQYENGKTRLLRTALNRGYLKANLADHRIRVYPEQRRAEIDLTLASGIRYQFGEVDFGDYVINRELMEAYSDIETGEPYAADKLLELQNALFDSDYFSRVEVSPQLDRAEGRQVPIEVATTAGKRHRYSFGIGYGTDTGARGTVGYKNRRINRRGHRFFSTLRLSELQENLTAGYVIPFRNPRTDQWEISASLIDDHPDSDRQEQTSIVGVSRRVSPRPNWVETLYLNYRQDSYQIGADKGQTLQLVPGAIVERIKGRVKDNQRTGNRFSLEVRGGHESFVSDITFFQPMLTAKVIHGLTRKSRVLLRGEVAGTLINGFDDLPLSLRYYAGGDNSVRGYGYQRLSPRNADGDVVGGKQKLVGSIEFDYMFREKWSAAAFFDTGNAFDDWNDIGLEQGVGVGVRWYTPVGPLRIDLAKGISEPGSDLRLHLVFGPDL